MIRISDLNLQQWARVSTTPTRSIDATDPTSWFDEDGVNSDISITADVSPGARGLSAEQHARRVLMQLCGGGGDPSL
ncbi:MAG TPA: hypothetical protein VFP68_24190 [Burkholderiaceae bacterium]|nr:hypothetical protein [Burkholderiaceae bacterium]